MNLFKFGDAYDRLGCFADSGSARVLSGAFKKNDPDMTTAVIKPATMYKSKLRDVW